MKINLVLPHQLPFPPTRGGGVENLVWLLAREFAGRGHVVTAYSRASAELAMRETDASGIRHIRVEGYDRHPNRWVDHINGLRYARHIFPVLESAEITSFHTPFSFFLRKKAGLEVCAHTIHRTPKWPVPLYRGLDRVYCGSDAVVRQAARVDAGIGNLKRVYNCIAVDAEPALSQRARDEGLLFLYVGRFVPDKGLESLVKGFESSLTGFPENQLRTVGPQDSENGADERFFRHMSEYIVHRGLAKSVRFDRPIFNKAQLQALYAEADVICVPSLNGETFSMAVLEAMAAAKPVLVSDFSPMPEAVDHRVTGYVARAGDAASIAEGMRFFSERPGELPAIGRAGFEKAQRCFSVKKIAAEYLQDFEELLAMKRARNCSR